MTTLQQYYEAPVEQRWPMMRERWTGHLMVTSDATIVCAVRDLLDDMQRELTACKAKLDICHRYACYEGANGDCSELAIDYGGTGYEKDPAVVAVAKLQQQSVDGGRGIIEALIAALTHLAERNAGTPVCAAFLEAIKTAEYLIPADQPSDAKMLDWLQGHCAVEWPFGNTVRLSVTITAPDAFKSAPTLREAVRSTLGSTQSSGTV